KLLAAILGEMDRRHLVRDALEIERDARAIGRRRAEIGIELHASPCLLPGATPAAAGFIPETVLWSIDSGRDVLLSRSSRSERCRKASCHAAGHFARMRQSALQAALTRGIFCNA